MWAVRLRCYTLSQTSKKNVSHRKQPSFRDAITGFPAKWRMGTSAEIPYWWRITTKIWVVLLIGRAAWEICFNQSKARPRSGSDTSSLWNFISWNFVKQIAPCVSTGRELSFEWSHHRISSTDSKVRVTLQNSIKHSGSERVKPQSVSNPYAQSAFDTLVRTVAIRCIWLHFLFHRLTSATPV